ncbi:tryptophan 7-halogenase [Sphingomonas koreensis]|nr:tryptophan 7-halogenase [Sphingomonas koreensis]
MTGQSEPIRTVLVVGGGIVGWSAAAALRRKLPWLTVTIVPQPVPVSSLADTMPCALPSIMGFHADLGLSQQDAVLRTGSAYRLGTLFAGWSSKQPDYLHAYGTHGKPLGAISFHLHWARLAAGKGALPFDHHGPAAALARAGRFTAPSPAPDALFNGFEYGLQLDIGRYMEMMRAFALHCGVRERPGTVASVDLRPDGLIDRIALDYGASLSADLFVDCTGPAATLRGAIDGARDDWSGQLPCDRLLLAEGPAPADLPLHDTVTATPAGWRWRAATTARSLHGICYASTFCDDTNAARQLQAASGVDPSQPPIAISPGTRPDPWRGNCVAVGDSATVIEPLEWSNLHLAHSGIDRIVAMMPGADCAPVELAEFNRQSRAEATRVRDFVLLHYATSSRREPFWRAAAATALPPSLAHSLALFRDRGRLPVYEEETFARDSWLAVLFGQGVIPRRIDPLAEAVPVADVAQAMAGFRNAIDAALPQFPTHADYLAAQIRQIAR